MLDPETTAPTPEYSCLPSQLRLVSSTPIRCAVQFQAPLFQIVFRKVDAMSGPISDRRVSKDPWTLIGLHQPSLK